MMKVKEHIVVIIGAIILATAFLLLNSFSTHPILPCKESYIDSQIFQYMGYAMLNGKIPYTDLFDHKGLLLYVINAVGYIIHQGWGVFILQVINLAATITTWWKGLEFVEDKKYKFILIVSMIFCLYVYYTYGNSTEEWSLFFLSYPMMVFYRQNSRGENQISKMNLYLIGLCIGCIFMLRLNNVAPVLGVILYAAYKALKGKDYRYFTKAFFFIFLGWLTPILLSFAYMYIVGGTKGMYDMYYATVLFNIDYKAIYGGNPTLYDRTRFFYKAMMPALFALLIIRKKLDYIFPLFLGYLIVIPATGKSENYVYLQGCLVLMVYTMACLDTHKLKYLFLIILVGFHAKTFVKSASLSSFSLNKDGSDLMAIHEVLARVPHSEWDNIWQYGTCYMLKDLMTLHILQPNRMFLNGQLNESYPLMKEERYKVQQIRPQYILTARYNKEKWMNETREYDGSELDVLYIKKNYSIIASAIGEDNTEIYLYKKNNSQDKTCRE